jgi:glucan phosphoethanolaminetransferase (alkaline phosphatase superfamily)
MKRIVGWIMMLIALIIILIIYAPLIGIAQTLLMLLEVFLSCAWVGVAVVLINSGNYKKGTDNEKEEVSE